MKISGYVVLVGMVLLIYAIVRLRHSGVEHLLSTELVILSVIAGVAVFGGLFSCALALFFHLWHQKAEDCD